MEGLKANVSKKKKKMKSKPSVYHMLSVCQMCNMPLKHTSQKIYIAPPIRKPEIWNIAYTNANMDVDPQELSLLMGTQNGIVTLEDTGSFTKLHILFPVSFIIAKMWQETRSLLQ